MNAYKQDCSNSLDSDSKSSSLNSRTDKDALTKDTNFVYLPGEVCQDVKNDVTYICPYSGSEVFIADTIVLVGFDNE